MKRLMENYRQACEGRLRLWVSPELKVTCSEPARLVIEHAGRRLLLEFRPATCSWSLEGPEALHSPNFDLLLKRSRQLLTDFAQ